MTNAKTEEMKAHTLDKNSSITRVRPVLGPLFNSKREGTALLQSLLSFLNRGPGIPQAIREEPGEILSWCRKTRAFSEKGYRKQPLPGAFEASAPPSGAFLRWLVQNPDKLEGDPGASGSEKVRRNRKALKGELGPERMQRAAETALLNLDASGATGAGNKWWALEGPSSIDCLIETEKLVLFIEGKRTEPLSESISWYRYRNQVSRNLECAQQWAAGDEKAFGVIVIHEEGENEESLCTSLSKENLSRSLPHLSQESRERLLQHFLGKLTWQELVSKWKLDPEKHLPETVADTPYAVT